MQLMTFEGTNFDIISGITAPFIYYFGYVRRSAGRKLLIAWNIMCMLLLANVVITALRNSQDEVIGFSKVTHDLTEKKALLFLQKGFELQAAARVLVREGKERFLAEMCAGE